MKRLIGLCFCLLLSSSCFIIDGVGGAFSYEPEELDSGLSPGAKELVQRAFADVDRAKLADYHVHLAGMGAGGTGNWVNPKMSSFLLMTLTCR